MSSVYFDASALVKTLIDEDGSTTAKRAWAGAAWLNAGRSVNVETCAALASARRQRRISADQHAEAKKTLNARWSDVDVVELDNVIMRAAGSLAERERLRGYDAVHLASALRAADVLVSADADLLAAAQRVGLQVINVRA